MSRLSLVKVIKNAEGFEKPSCVYLNAFKSLGSTWEGQKRYSRLAPSSIMLGNIKTSL